MRFIMVLLMVTLGLFSYHTVGASNYREFPSVEAFQKWGENVVIAKFNSGLDCDDDAETMQRLALEDGWLISQAIVNNQGYLANTYVADTKGQYHVGLMAIIGNGYYYMDTRTREVVKIQITRD